MLVLKGRQQGFTTLVTAYQKIAIVKYDAFKEMGGKLSNEISRFKL